MNKNGLAYYVISISLAVVVIIALLQPFGVDRIESHKYPIILGYGFLTALAILVSEFITSFVFRMKRGSKSKYRIVIINALVTFIMGFLITCYASVIFTGNIRSAFYDTNGDFTLNAFWINCFYAIVISFFLSIYSYFVDRNRLLSERLKEEIELNKALERRASQVLISQSESIDIVAKDEEKIIIKGNTKESLEVLPSMLQFIEAEGNYINVFYLENGVSQKKTLRCTLKQVEELFKDYPNIIRCHRAFIVNIDKIKHVDGNAQGYRLHIDDTDRTVLVSRAYATSVYDIIES
ncbi:LytR/AlgR family response regulator transcription factor [Phocaeicola paurosaccharolyticus]|jgi:multisubunit Na+/H+ antiporter MnhF subunit|uniref:LytR/AlgR family response regulator transcription factor n=1 Tax=Phocaeicola paurosaccharolyticus TaxID=732242 RepID=UPI00046ADAC3|nr:LytTR family transcriptional regulator DNA-binding domain-containing protein [Phocaeicola paurosaccharolyticus]